MFMRACDADAKRRTAELAADALSQRVATLESELREARAQAHGKHETLTQNAEGRARELEQRLHASEGRAREAEEIARAMGDKRREAEQTVSMLENAARAAKDESASLAQRIELLEGELARGDQENFKKRAQGLEAELARLVRRTTELERDRAIARRGEDAAVQQATDLRAEIEVVRSVLADLEADEARIAEARRRTFSDARQLLERAERRGTDVATAREPLVKVAPIASVPPRPELPTPTAVHRGHVGPSTTKATVAAKVRFPAAADADRKK
jgi:chromosome segregation ATPase